MQCKFVGGNFVLFFFMDLNRSTIPQLKKLMKDQGVIMPTQGSGKNGMILKKDLIVALLSAPSKRQSIVPLPKPPILKRKLIIAPLERKPAPEVAPSLSFSERYDIIRELGEGGFGVVYLAASRKDRSLVAVKEMPLE